MSYTQDDNWNDFERLIKFGKKGTLSSIIIESSDLAIKAKTLEGIITSWNHGAEKMYGYLAAEIIGQNVEILIPKNLRNELIDKKNQIREGHTITNFESKRIRKDGKVIDVMLFLAPIKDEKGKIIGIASLDRDITNLIIASEELIFQNEEKEKRENTNKELEELSNSLKLVSQYARSIIEASRDPLFAVNLHGKIVDVNEASLIATDKSREEITGTDFLDYFTVPIDGRKAYKEIFDKGFITDFPLTIKDGKNIDVLCNGSVYKDNKGDEAGVVIVARDVTEQRRIATELTEAKVLAELAAGIAEGAKQSAERATCIAEDAVKAKQQFLSNMSHEIRTPMNAIIGFTKVVLKTELTLLQKEYMQAIKMSGDTLIVLINDILDLAKVDSSKMIFEQTPFKMSMSISAILHLFEPKIQEKNLVLVKEYDRRIPEVLLGDPVRLHQIILNLISNAVKFTNKGKITVSVQLVKEDEKTATIKFAVSDTGIGIAKNKIDKIFENFQQASSITSRLYGGTGLGLAIVKQLVEPQGGKIEVQSKIDEGSSFNFELIFQKTNMKVDFEDKIEENSIKINNVSVLVVEDIALNQLLMKTLLDDFEFECDIASNGKIALDKLKNNAYDIILMDLQMPEMNGFETTEYIRNILQSKIPIIALTADVTTVDLAKCKAVGMDDYIAKPVDEKLLYNKIVSLMKKPLILDDTNETKKETIETLRYINLTYLLHRTKSNPALMMEMISLYLEQTPPLIGAMKKSFEDKNWKLLESTIHKMIPSFSIMGINSDFENMARKVHEYASTQQQANGINDMILEIEKVCMQACKELENEFNAIKNKK